ncbi:MAG: hypothetical protein L6427_02075 [Actinomycetia bacterium]|nr:hypothetical protein [Actinomycetes bacterium]
MFIRSFEKPPGRLLAVLLALVLSGVFTVAGPMPGSARADLGIGDVVKIKELIYPTLGNPAIVESGTRLTLEFDPGSYRSM